MTGALMFDCDGVLVDSERLIAHLLVGLANEMGAALTVSDGLDMFCGVQLSLCAERISAHLGRDVTAHIMAAYDDRCAEAFRRRLTPVPGVEELIRSVTLPRCVVSNSARQRVVHKLAVTGLSQYFGDHVYSASDLFRWKPDPDVYLHAAAQLSVDPARCVAIEDSAVGVRAAVAAGMSVIGFGPPELLAAGARWTRTSMREVQHLVHSLTPLAPARRNVLSH